MRWIPSGFVAAMSLAFLLSAATPSAAIDLDEDYDAIENELEEDLDAAIEIEQARRCGPPQMVRYPDGQYRPYDRDASYYDRFGRIVIPYPDGTWRYNDGSRQGSKPDPYPYRFDSAKPNWSRSAWESWYSAQRYLESYERSRSRRRP